MYSSNNTLNLQLLLQQRVRATGLEFGLHEEKIHKKELQKTGDQKKITIWFVYYGCTMIIFLWQWMYNDVGTFT